MQRVLCFLVLVAILCHTLVLGDEDLQVFILPHSHIDQGWLRTVGEYRDETLGILRSVIESMGAAQDRKYVWGDVYDF
jgi:alpha-mannosidase II